MAHSDDIHPYRVASDDERPSGDGAFRRRAVEPAKEAGSRAGGRGRSRGGRRFRRREGASSGAGALRADEADGAIGALHAARLVRAVKTMKRTARAVAPGALAFALGAAVGKVSILDVPAVFSLGLGQALVASRRPVWALLALLGGMWAGAGWPPGVPAGTAQSLAAAPAGLEKWVVPAGWAAAVFAVRMWSARRSAAGTAPAALVAASFLAGSGLFAVVAGGTAYAVGEVLIGAVLAGLYAHLLLPFAAKVCGGVPGRTPFARLAPSEKVGLFAFGTALLLAGHGVQMWHVDLLGVASGWVILIASDRAGARGGAATGLFIGFVLGLAVALPPVGSATSWAAALGSGVGTGAMFAMVAAGRLGVCGLVAGVARQVGRRFARAATSAGFAAGVALLGIGISDPGAWKALWVSAGVAALLFMFTPARWFRSGAMSGLFSPVAAPAAPAVPAAGEYVDAGRRAPLYPNAQSEPTWAGPGMHGTGAPEDAQPSRPADVQAAALRDHIEEVSGIFRQMSVAFRERTEEQVRDGRGMNTFVQSVYKEVCAGCRMREACWNEAFFQTYWDLVGYAAGRAGSDSGERPSEERTSRAASAAASRGAAGRNGGTGRGAASKPTNANLRMLGGLRRRCIQPVRLVEAADAALGRQHDDRAWEGRMSAAYGLVGVQMDGVADMLAGFAREGVPVPGGHPAVEDRLRRSLASASSSAPASSEAALHSGRAPAPGGGTFRVSDVSVSAMEGGEKDGEGEERLAVRVRTILDTSAKRPGDGAPARPGAGDDVDLLPVVLRLCDVLSQTFGIPYILWRSDRGLSDREFRLLFVPEPPYDFQVCARNEVPSGAKESGDTTATIHLPDGRLALLLSDGMGTGASAARESRTTAALLESMLRAGLDWRFAARMVNTILVLRSPRERFATVDLGLLDLYDGSCLFVKIGASPSFVKRARGGKRRSSRPSVEMVSAASLPLGILSDVDAEVRPVKLEVGDLLVWLSDGVLDARKEATDKEAWLMRVLRTVDTSDPFAVSARVMAASSERGGEAADDDRTVVAVRLVRRHARKVGKRPIEGDAGPVYASGV